MTAYLDFAPESDQIAAFYFEGNADHSLTHGTYELDEKLTITAMIRFAFPLSRFLSTHSKTRSRSLGSRDVAAV